MRQKLLDYSLEIFCACVIVLFIMLVALGILEMFAHTAIIFLGRLGRPYSPGMASAWIMGTMAAYSIVQVNAAGLATGSDYALGTVLMIAGFALMQRATLTATDMSYGTFLRSMRNLLLGRFRRGPGGSQTRA